MKDIEKIINFIEETLGYKLYKFQIEMLEKVLKKEEHKLGEM